MAKDGILQTTVLVNLGSSIVYVQKISILPHRRDWNFLGGGVSLRTKKLKKRVKLYWNFQGGGDFRKIPSVGEVWIFSGTTHFYSCVRLHKLLERCQYWKFFLTQLLGKLGITSIFSSVLSVPTLNHHIHTDSDRLCDRFQLKAI